MIISRALSCKYLEEIAIFHGLNHHATGDALHLLAAATCPFSNRVDIAQMMAAIFAAVPLPSHCHLLNCKRQVCQDHLQGINLVTCLQTMVNLSLLSPLHRLQLLSPAPRHCPHHWEEDLFPDHRQDHLS